MVASTVLKCTEKGCFANAPVPWTGDTNKGYQHAQNFLEKLASIDPHVVISFSSSICSLPFTEHIFLMASREQGLYVLIQSHFIHHRVLICAIHCLFIE